MKQNKNHCEDCANFCCFGYQHYGCARNCKDDMPDQEFCDNVISAGPLDDACEEFSAR